VPEEGQAADVLLHQLRGGRLAGWQAGRQAGVAFIRWFRCGFGFGRWVGCVVGYAFLSSLLPCAHDVLSCLQHA